MDRIDLETRRLELVHRLNLANRHLRAFDEERLVQRAALLDARARTYRELAQFDTDTAMRAGLQELAKRGELDALVRP